MYGKELISVLGLVFLVVVTLGNLITSSKASYNFLHPGV